MNTSKQFSHFRSLSLFVAALSCFASAADHREAPLVQLDGRTDINDIYAFQSPTNSNNTVLIMTVNPLAGVSSPTSFDSEALYEIHFAANSVPGPGGRGTLSDLDKNGKTDIVDFAILSQQYLTDCTGAIFPFPTDCLFEQRITVFFSQVNPGDGSQFVFVQGRGVESSGQVGVVNGLYDSTTFDQVGQMYAGLRDDPFFFDLDGFQGTGGRSFCDGDEVDFFAGLNVSAIVLEVLSSKLGSDNLEVWGRTVKRGQQVDRMGRPLINTILLPDSAKKSLFNQGLPDDDPFLFFNDVYSSLISLGADPGTANGLASVLLPDVLTMDTSNPAGFLNGRRLGDDVVDVELNLFTGGVITTDCIDSNDKPFLSTFPYLAEPH